MSLSAAHSQRGVSEGGEDDESLGKEDEEKRNAEWLSIPTEGLFVLMEAKNPIKPQESKETVGAHSAPHLVPAQRAPCVR